RERYRRFSLLSAVLGGAYPAEGRSYPKGCQPRGGTAFRGRIPLLMEKSNQLPPLPFPWGRRVPFPPPPGKSTTAMGIGHLFFVNRKNTRGHHFGAGKGNRDSAELKCSRLVVCCR